jgi:citrate lyase beta subunit
MTAITSLEAFARRAKQTWESPKCEVCGVPIADAHRHVVDRSERKLLCACVACVLAFEGEGSARFRSVPEDVRDVDRDALGSLDLVASGVPVGLAFFFRPSSLRRLVAVFPSPAGATEAELAESAEAALSAVTSGLADDVEALLARRSRDGTVTAFIVPIDVCYELTALVRTRWRGVDGGAEGRAEVDAFFARVGERARGAR